MSWLTDLQHTVRDRLDSHRIADSLIPIEPWINRWDDMGLDPMEARLTTTYIDLQILAMEQEFAGK